MDAVNTFNERLNTGQKPGIVAQAIFGLALIVALYLTLMFVEIVYKYINRMRMNRTVLLPNTYNVEDKMMVIGQNPNISGSIPVYLSNNERSGIEFSYTFYLNVHPASFRQEYGLNHIFHKGFSQQFPLLAPGVYMRSDTNTLRVYINSYKTWNNYLEVENIPVSKWVHIAIVCKDKSFEVYVNGNLARKMSFDGFAPYQNYEDVYCFSQRRITLKQSLVPSVDENGFDVYGAMKGMLSRLSYFSYALCYAEIQQLMNEGPSTTMDSASISTNLPPYLNDTWWSHSY
jgi:hypothetical protein